MTTPSDMGSPGELNTYGGSESIAEHVTGVSVELVATDDDVSNNYSNVIIQKFL